MVVAIGCEKTHRNITFFLELYTQSIQMQEFDCLLDIWLEKFQHYCVVRVNTLNVMSTDSQPLIVHTQKNTLTSFHPNEVQLCAFGTLINTIISNLHQINFCKHTVNTEAKNTMWYMPWAIKYLLTLEKFNKLNARHNLCWPSLVDMYVHILSVYLIHYYSPWLL